MRLHLQLQAQKFHRVRTGWVTVNPLQGVCSASNLPGQRKCGSPGRAGTPCPPPAPARIWDIAQLGSLHPTLSGVLGKASPGRAGESRSFASGIQPSSLRASLSENLGSSQPSPPGCPQQDGQLCRASASLANKCPQSPGTQHQTLHPLNHCCDNPVCSVSVTEENHNQEKQQDYPPAPVPTERIITAGCINDIPWASPREQPGGHGSPPEEDLPPLLHAPFLGVFSSWKLLTDKGQPI